jgi:hypothetical protein
VLACETDIGGNGGWAVARQREEQELLTQRPGRETCLKVRAKAPLLALPPPRERSAGVRDMASMYSPEHRRYPLPLSPLCRTDLLPPSSRYSGPVATSA